MDEKVTSPPKDMDESTPPSYLQVPHEMHFVVVVFTVMWCFMTTFF